MRFAKVHLDSHEISFLQKKSSSRIACAIPQKPGETKTTIDEQEIAKSTPTSERKKKKEKKIDPLTHLWFPKSSVRQTKLVRSSLEVKIIFFL